MSKIPTVPELAQKKKIQKKYLTATRTGNGTMPSLDFNNLVVGKWYEVNAQWDMRLDSGVSASGAEVRVSHNGSDIGRTTFVITETTDTGQDINISHMTIKFQAQASSLSFYTADTSANAIISAGANDLSTWVILIERDDLEETTEFS